MKGTNMNYRTSRATLLVCGVAAAQVGCGSGSQAPNSVGQGGASGSSGIGGASANGGGNSASSGASASNGGGGAGGSGAATCASGATKPPVSALITDFSDAAPDPANAGEFRFGAGTAARVQGGTTIFSNPASTPGVLSLSGGALSFSATVSAPAASGADEYPFNGFVLYIDGPACVDASAYSGMSFTLSGTLGTCNLTLAFAYADDLAATSDANRGLCSGTCYPAQYSVTTSFTAVDFGATPTVVGMPVPKVDQAKLLGVQWQLEPSGTASCTGNFTVDNVMFK
jgi:hypothetical protein